MRRGLTELGMTIEANDGDGDDSSAREQSAKPSEAFRGVETEEMVKVDGRQLEEGSRRQGSSERGSQGHQVGGEDAIQVYSRQRRKAISVEEVSQPGMTGEDVVEALQNIVDESDEGDQMPNMKRKLKELACCLGIGVEDDSINFERLLDSIEERWEKLKEMETGTEGREIDEGEREGVVGAPGG